jgi:hypothetical protein
VPQGNKDLLDYEKRQSYEIQITVKDRCDTGTCYGKFGGESFLLSDCRRDCKLYAKAQNLQLLRYMPLSKSTNNITSTFFLLFCLIFGAYHSLSSTSEPIPYFFCYFTVYGKTKKSLFRSPSGGYHQVQILLQNESVVLHVDEIHCYEKYFANYC